MYTINATVKLFVIAIVSLISASISAAESTPVTIGNFVRAESDHMIRTNMKAFHLGFNKFFHQRQPTTPDNQPVIRMNQDTLNVGSRQDSQATSRALVSHCFEFLAHVGFEVKPC